MMLAALLVSAVAYAQPQPVKWTASVNKVDGDLYRVSVSARIDSGYHIYDLGPYNQGPNETVIQFELVGAELEGDIVVKNESKKEYDDIFEMEIGIYEGGARFEQLVRATGADAAVTVHTEWQCCNDTACFPPDEWDETVKLGESTVSAAPAKPSKASKGGNAGLLGLIIEAILWGFAMLLTPCVFPMVPMTISFFMKGSETAAKGRFKAFMYGLFIVLLYTIPICVIIGLTWVLGGSNVTADIFNWIATHWLPNLIFFIVFMVFAASFFGAFEITLPSKWTNASDSKSGKDGLGGIFFLALTLVLVSFSCTGPIVGTVLIKSTQGEFWTPMVTMLAFSVAFALPFTVLALFPSLIKKLPKSGGWLNSVKVVLGFIEIALGLKFLSTADQTYHWHLLDREIYLAIWIVVFTLLGLYLLGKIRFKNDSPLEYLSVGRLALAIGVFTFVVYMIPGMWGAPLKGLSGYLPPITSQDFVLSQNVAATPSAQVTQAPSGRKYADKLELPFGIEGFFDLDEAREYAASVGKPLFIDFTGHGCVNCREMEARVWSDPQVLSILKNDYVVCALYCDDKSEVAQEDWVTNDKGKVLKQLGKINSYYMLNTFGVNAQPYYVLQSADGKSLGDPRAYNLDVNEFVKFLQGGLAASK